MRETLEREVKLAPGEGFVFPELGGEALPSRVFTSTYLDTPDLTLLRHGVTFRYRSESGTGLWQLKLPRGAARIELELPGAPARPPGEMTALLPAYLRGRELVRVARLRTRREGVRIDGAEVVDDAVAVLDGQRVTRRFRELEVELVDGDERTLRRLEKALRRAGATPGGLRPKLSLVLDVADEPRSERPAPGATPSEAVATALFAQYRRLLAHDPGTRLGTDPEDLHQLRVATRRARAFLRAAMPLLDRDWANGLRSELAWLGGALGPVRDLDVQIEHLEREVASLHVAAPGLIDGLAAERDAARATLRETLADPRYLALLDAMETTAQPAVDASADETLAGLWWREWKRTRRVFGKLGSRSPDDELHAARIRVKRARYAAELALGELGEPGEAFVDTAKALQEILGDHQDASIAEERIGAWAAAEPTRASAAEVLLERQRGRKATARADWRAAWEKLERRGRRARP